MYDLLSIEEDTRAAAQGWCIEYVFDCKSDRLNVVILPINFVKPLHNSYAAAALVVSQARDGNALAVKALRLLQRGFVPPGKKTK